MKKKSIFIALPAYTGQIHVGTMKSLMGDLMTLAFRGDRIAVHDRPGALIGDCRAALVALFLAEKDATHLVMIDHDVVWQPGGLVKLVDHDVDFVCGMYPGRSDPIRFNFRSPMMEGGELNVDRKTGLVEAWGVPAGFVCFSRSMLEKMVAHYADLEFEVEAKDIPGNRAWALFDPYRLPDSKVKLGEDYAFCQRWRDIGGKVWVDPFIPMGHIGFKTFAGEFGRWFQSESEEDVAA